MIMTLLPGYCGVIDMFRVMHVRFPMSNATVYATRINEDGNTEFLMYYMDEWRWVLADDYKPMPL